MGIVLRKGKFDSGRVAAKRLIVSFGIFCFSLDRSSSLCSKHFASSRKMRRRRRKIIQGTKEVALYTSHYYKTLDKCFTRILMCFPDVEEEVEIEIRTAPIRHLHWSVT